MTAQIEDQIVLEGVPHHLKTDLSAFIRPENWGMTPRMLHTACWRGYHAVLAVEEGVLLLQELTLRIAEGAFAEINGKLPATTRGSEATYTALGLRLRYTGQVTAAKDFDRRQYRHMGFHPASAYGTVVEMAFEEGVLVTAEARTQTPEGAVSPSAAPGGLTGWVIDRFSRDDGSSD